MVGAFGGSVWSGIGLGEVPGNAEGLCVCRHVVDAEEACPGVEVRDGAGERGRESLIERERGLCCERADETFAAEGGEDRASEREKFLGSADEHRVLLDGFAEAEAGIEDDAFRIDAGFDRSLHKGVQGESDVLDGVALDGCF